VGGEYIDGSPSGESVPTQTNTTILPSSKKATKKQLLNEMVARCMVLQGAIEEEQVLLDDSRIGDVIREVLVAEGEPLCLYKDIDYRDSIVRAMQPERWKDEFLNYLAKRNRPAY